jgi:hypothetical protein
MVPTRYAEYVTAAFFAGVLGAQTQPPGVLRGFLMPGGNTVEHFVVRSNGNEFPFRRDCLTWVERDQQRIGFTDLRPGEHIEVICDRDDPIPHYARVIHVITEAQRRAITRSSYESYRLPNNPIESLAPRGDMVFSGFVSQLTGDAMLLQTRKDGVKTIYLRSDTRFLQGGLRVDAKELRPHTRIFVRAGTTLDNEIVAFQVVWGPILVPEP